MKPKQLSFLFVVNALLGITAAAVFPAMSREAAPDARRTIYAVSQLRADRGSISVYDIDAGHHLIKTIPTVPNVGDVRGVAVSAATGKLYVAYRDGAGIGKVYCVNVYDDTILWDKPFNPGVDRLAIDPEGTLLYLPTWEDNSADYINIVDANTGDVVHKVYFSNHSHDTQYPISGPVFQETKAGDGSGNYLYMIDPKSYVVSRVGPYAGILGPYAVNGTSTYAANNVTHLWGMQVANLRTGEITTSNFPNHPSGDPELPHGIGWTPDETEVWQSSAASDPHIYIWDMRNPMAPLFSQRLTLRSGRGSHWLTFTIAGDYGYVAPSKHSADGTEIFDVRTHTSIGVISSSEDLLEIDFANGKINRVGDQYGIGRKSGSRTKATER